MSQTQESKPQKEKMVTVPAKEFKKLQLCIEKCFKVLLTEIKKKKDRKRPKTAYQLYLENTREELRKQYEKENKKDAEGKIISPSSTDVYKEAGKKWKEITEKAKKEEVDKKGEYKSFVEEHNKWVEKAKEEKSKFKSLSVTEVPKFEDIQIKPRVKKNKKSGGAAEIVATEIKNEVKPIEIKNEVKPVETKPVEVKNEVKQETKPVEIKNEAKPVETKQEVKPVEVKNEVKQETKPAEAKPAETKKKGGRKKKEKVEEPKQK